MTKDTQPSNLTPGTTDVLGQVREGMAVYDSEGKHIGKVATLYMGAEADTIETGVVIERAAPGDPAVNVPIATIADVLGKDVNMPDTVRNRMEQQGFIRVAMSGLLSGHRYALREHVASVSGDQVNLTITRDGLLHV